MADNRRRVLVFNHFAMPPGEAGGTRHVELFDRMPDWSATIVAANRGLLQHNRRVAPHPLFKHVWVVPSEGNGPRRVAGWLSYFVSASAAGVRAERPDVVYGSSPHLLGAAAGWLVAKRWRAPFVLEVRDLWPKVLSDMGVLAEASPLYQALAALESFLYRRAALIIAMAEGTKRTLEARDDVRCPVIFVPNGADVADFSVAADRPTLRRRYGFERFTVVYAGAHGPANGLEFVVNAAAALQHAGTPVDFALVGDGADKAALREGASTRALTNVRFLDPVPKAEMPSLLAAADAGLHCLADVELFRYGVSPNKLFDYMAAGLPVITNTPGEVADLVRRSGAGLSCSPAAIADAAQALAAMDPHERAECGAAGRAFIERHRSRSAMAERLSLVLEQVVCGARGSTPSRHALRLRADGARP